MFWCVRAVSCASHALKPDDCLVRCCITALAPCTNSLRRYWFPRRGIFHNVCFPPVECSSGTTPNQAAKSRPLRNAAPLPIVAMIAVALTGPTPGITTSLRQASFSRAIFSIDLSARSIFSASCSSSCFSSAEQYQHCPRQLEGATCQYPRYFIHIAPAFAQCSATFEQKSTNLVHYSRSSHHPALTHSMQRLQAWNCSDIRGMEHAAAPAQVGLPCSDNPV